MGMEIGIAVPTAAPVGAVPAPGSGRGFAVLLGKLVGLNLNSVAATTIFTTPAAGFTRCVVEYVALDNYSMAATTASVSFGSSGTPTDFLGTQTTPTAATGKNVQQYPAVNTAYATYGTGIAFVANVTIPQGVAATCDVSVWGYYE